MTAHLSPDTDTTVASFWSWLDAFACQVSESLHLWSLPPGATGLPISEVFKQLFGEGLFETLPRSSTTLTLSAIDLISHHNLVTRTGETSINTLDHGINDRALVLVDEEGYYLGDWRSSDVELVRQVIILYKAALRWIENNLHTLLISLFSTEKLNVNQLEMFFERALTLRFYDCEVVNEFSDEQKERLEKFLKNVLEMENGLETTFTEHNELLKKRGVDALFEFEVALRTLPEQSFFDDKGELIEDRPLIFAFIEQSVNHLGKAMHKIRDYVERLDISIQIKNVVLEIDSPTINLETSVEIMRSQMKHYDYLIVTQENFPVGAVWAQTLRRDPLGTVSLRDFSNEQEAKISSYLSVISIIDHHKTQINTRIPPVAILSDAQACNVLIAEQAMQINDNYSDGVAPEREYIEYLFFIHAILDDTDLLTKVTARDVICVASLLNRMKEIQTGEKKKIIDLGDFDSPQEAARHILQNPDMYSLYKKSFAQREREVSKQIEEHGTALFADTKVQNQCCRVGQVKLFSSNWPKFTASASELYKLWTSRAENIHNSHPEIDLHLQMISTIASAQEIYEGQEQGDTHQDELWFWIPESDSAVNHLTAFLNNFSKAPEMVENDLSLEVSSGVEKLFKRNFLAIENVKVREDGERPVAILRFKAGSLNSRKAMVSPYLPRLVS